MLLFSAWICVSYVVGVRSEWANLYMVDYAKHFTMFIVATLVITSVRQVWIVVVLAATALGYIAYEINYLYFVERHIPLASRGTATAASTTTARDSCWLWACRSAISYGKVCGNGGGGSFLV